MRTQVCRVKQRRSGALTQPETQQKSAGEEKGKVGKRQGAQASSDFAAFFHQFEESLLAHRTLRQVNGFSHCYVELTGNVVVPGSLTATSDSESANQSAIGGRHDREFVFPAFFASCAQLVSDLVSFLACHADQRSLKYCRSTRN
jgi:hypothetical protein